MTSLRGTGAAPEDVFAPLRGPRAGLCWLCGQGTGEAPAGSVPLEGIRGEAAAWHLRLACPARRRCCQPHLAAGSYLGDLASLALLRAGGRAEERFVALLHGN